MLEDFLKHKDERIQKVQTEKLSYQASLDEMEKEKKALVCGVWTGGDYLTESYS